MSVLAITSMMLDMEEKRTAFLAIVTFAFILMVYAFAFPGAAGESNISFSFFLTHHCAAAPKDDKRDTTSEEVKANFERKFQEHRFEQLCIFMEENHLPYLGWVPIFAAFAVSVSFFGLFLMIRV